MTKNKIGYRNPPKETRFKAGQSGNPRGRPKGVRNLATDLKEEFEEQTTVEEAGHSYRVTKRRALVKALVARGLKQDVRAIDRAFDHYSRHIGEVPDAEESLDANELEILRRCAPRLLKSLVKKKGVER